MSLATFTPSQTLYFPAMPGRMAQSVFYFFPAGFTDCSQIPVGSTFGAVFSPSDVSATQSHRHWRYIRFVVTEHDDPRYGAHTRAYRVQRDEREEGRPQLVRELTSDEVAYFENLHISKAA